MKRFGDRLREARIAAGMTQEQLGFELGVTKSSVSAWENGRETPGFRLLETLRQTLGRSLDELICDSLPGAHTDASKDSVGFDAALARNPDERALLARYRRLSTSKRSAVLELIRRDER